LTAVLCAFVAGTWWLQQQVSLPGRGGWAVWALVAAVAAAACMVRTPWPGRPRGMAIALALRRAAALAFATTLGFGYAAWRADMRLATALPLEWEGRDITLTGVVRGLPMRSPRGLRFLFDVESTSPFIARFPATVQLSGLAVGGNALSALAPGERRTFVARLKRLRGNANFALPDAQVRALAQGVRAAGYVRAVLSPQPGQHDAEQVVPDHRVQRGGVRLGVRRVLNAVDRKRDAIRRRIVDVLQRSRPPLASPHAGIVIALAIGAQDGISDADWQRMRRTGTNHLMAISGLHIGSVAALAAAIGGMAWRRGFGRALSLPLWVPAPLIASLSGMLAATAYAALAGLGIPAQRTLTMLVVASLALASGRRVDSMLVLAWALAIVVLVDPWATLSPSTALSFGAVAAIAYALKGTAPHSGSVSEADDRPDWPALEGSEQPAGTAQEGGGAGRTTLVTLTEGGLDWLRAIPHRLVAAARVQWAVTIGLAPFTVLWFSQVPVVGLPANAVAIPWVSTLVVPCVLIAIVLPAPLDAHALHAAHWLIESLFAVLDIMARPAWAVWHLPVPTSLALVLAVAGVGWMLAPRRWPLRFAAPVLWLPLVWPASRAPPPGEFRVTALDIGQGTAVLVETAQRRLLFDAGPGPEGGNAGQRIVAPYLLAHGATPLDMVVISHRDADHAGGAPAVLAEVPSVRMVGSLPHAHPLWALARKTGASIGMCRAGTHWQWDGVTFEFLWPDGPTDVRKPNATACVLRISTLRQAVLIASDIERAAEQTLVSRDAQALASDVLIAPHHGSRTSSTEAFLDSVRPLVAIFQVGYRNRFNHPHPLVTSRYRARGVDMLRTDEDGAIRLDSDGSTLTIEAYRHTHRRYWMGR
jgi:competence protein ComEC